MAVSPVPLGKPTFLDSPRCGDLASLTADFAIIGVPYAYPYVMEAVTSPSGSAPAAIREQSCSFVQGDLTIAHYDFDFGGLTYLEASSLLRGIARKGRIVGYDIVEVVPGVDLRNLTSLCVARLTLNLMGEIVRQPYFLTNRTS